MILFYQLFFAIIAITCSVNAEIKDDVLFQRIGFFNDGAIEKTYWVPRYMKSQWYLTRPICKAYGFDILSLDTLDEMEAVADMCETNKDLFGWFVHIGGVASTSRSKTDWYWVNSNTKISYDMPWQNGQPDFSGSNEWCLTLEKSSKFKFNDIPCHGSWEEKFICQKSTDISLDIKNKIVKANE